MIKSFLSFLGGESGEEKPMLLLLGKGFFMGIFLAYYQIGSEGLFISELGKELFEEAFFVTGALGILSTVIFVNIQKRINYSTLIISNIFLIFLFMIAMRLAFELPFFQGAKGMLSLPFIMFVMLGPITAITILGFWGLFGRMFDLRASRRIIGGIDTGALTATILAFFSVPLIQMVPGMNQTYDLLLVACLAAFGVLFFSIWIVKSQNVDKATKVAKNEKIRKKVNFLDLLKDPYLRLLSLFLVFSMGASVFVDYTFYSVTEINFPKDEDLYRFLSFFNGTIMIMSFFIQSFVNDVIIGKFGLKVALMTMPIILILFTLGGIVSGHLFGFETRNQEFLFFFLFTVSAKAFTASLKDALENPAFKLFFLPIDIKIRFDIQTRIEGVVNEFATLLAGAVQLGLGLLVFFKLIHYSYFIIGLGAAVIFLAGKLFTQYKITLRKTLEKQKEELKGDGSRNENNIGNTLREEIASKKSDRIINGLKLLEKTDPIAFQYTLLDMLNVRFQLVRRHAYQKLGEYVCFEALEIIKRDAKTEGDEEALAIAKNIIAHLDVIAEQGLHEATMRKLVRSTDSNERVFGARLLSQAQEDSYLPFIFELLRDINPKVRVAAMISAGKVKRPELWPLLVENLHVPKYGNVAMSALKSSGEACLQTIDSAFYKTGQHQDTMLRIVQLFGDIGGKMSQEFLWKKIDFPDKKIVSEILLSLSYLGFQAKDFQAARIKIILESEIGDIAWNIKTTLDIPKETDVDLLIIDAFKEEDRKNYDNLFILLSMIYDSQNILLIKENIQDGTTDSITFAVEMMDVFVEDELKPKLFPVVDDLTVENRLKKLNDYYPPEDFESYEDLLLQVINRDYNRINRYTKALALFRICQMPGSRVSDDIIANLFNPDPFILQTAAFAIYTIDTPAYHQHTQRLKPHIKKDLDKAILPPIFRGEDEDFHQKLLLIERVLFLKKVEELKRIPGELITYMAEGLDEIRVNHGTVVIGEGDSGESSVYVIVEGDVDIYEGDVRTESLTEGGIFGHQMLLASDQFGYTALARNECTLLELKKENLVNLISKHIEVLDVFVDIMNNVKEERVELSDILLNI